MPLPTKQPLMTDVAQMTFKDRLRLAIEAAACKLPKAVGSQLLQLLDPTALAVMAGVTAIWAGLQFTGAGEVADVALLVVGWAAVGGAAWQGGRELIQFAVGVDRAKTQKDIDQAGAHLATAVSLLGVQAVLGMLLHTAPKPYRSPANIDPQLWKGWWDLGPAPRSPSGRWSYKPTVKVVPPSEMAPNSMGETSFWGDISVSSSLSKDDARETVLHEQVHSFLTPKLYILRELRAQIKIQGYHRSVILRYLEEAAAETYAQLRTKGLNMNAFLTGIHFPAGRNYSVSFAKAGTEVKAIFLGPIVVGGMGWNVWMTRKNR